VALAAGLLLIWSEATHTGLVFRLCALAAIGAVTGAHASLLLHRRRATDAQAVIRLVQAAVGASTAAAILLSCLILFAHHRVASGVWRLFGVLIVVAVIATLLVPLARRIQSSGGRPGGDAGRSTPSSGLC
jgi:hypothetical protein